MARELTNPLSQRERISHAFSRLAYGMRPGDMDRVLESGLDAWIEDQLGEKEETNPDLLDRLNEFETLDMDVAECAEFTYSLSPFVTGADREKLTEEEKRADRLQRRIPKEELVQSIALRAVLSRRQVTEVLSDFWRNHFNVSYTKGDSIFSQITDYHREVIRENVWRSFPSMLKASAKHPAMLNYLDNHLSRRAPNKQELDRIERRTRRKTGSREEAEEAVSLALQRGLNENYARELLELHTLGVDNYYDQKDVEAVANIFTGWTIDRGRKGTQEYRFDNEMHAPGDFKVLGKRFSEDKLGFNQQGIDLIEMLAKHKGTSEFVAMKLVRYLVSDYPSESLVKEVAKVYRKTNGDMKSMIRAIIESEEFYSRENYRTKFKTPYEYVVSALRITDAKISSLKNLGSYLSDMGQVIMHCDDPTGYYDTADAWLDPGVMALRWQFATDLVAGKVRGVEVGESFYDQVPTDSSPRLWQHHLTKLILPGGAGMKTRAALATITTEYLDSTRRPDFFKLAPRLTGLLLGSPEFQQQ